MLFIEIIYEFIDFIFLLVLDFFKNWNYGLWFIEDRKVKYFEYNIMVLFLK